MTKVNFKQRNLFGELLPPTIAIKESASRLGVSTATIRNWIKTKYLEQVGKGRITLESLERFQEEVSGKEKLNQRANKSLKDSHDHKKTTSRFLGKISASSNVSEKTGIAYEESLSDSYRNKEGIYYTPSAVVRDLFSAREEEISDATFCDPCCGSGNFIVRAIELGFKPEHIYGYDVDPIAVEITKARIFKSTGYENENIKVANFLDMVSEKEAAKFAVREAEALKNDEKNPRLKLKATTLMRVRFSQIPGLDTSRITSKNFNCHAGNINSELIVCSDYGDLIVCDNSG